MTTEANQRFFNTAYAHAQAMPGPAAEYIGDMTTCLYRTPDGNRCLVGANIPDECYDPNFEDFILPAVLQKTNISDVDRDLAGEVQSAHDSEAGRVLQGALSVEEWRADMLSRLRLIATAYNLEVPA